MTVPANQSVADPLGELALVDLATSQILLDALPFYVLIIDEELTVLLANQAAQTILYQTPESLLGWSCLDIIDQADGPKHGCPLELALADGGAVETESYDEALGAWTLSAVYPLEQLSAAGKRVFLHFAQDITREKRAAAALAQSLEHHRALAQLLERLQHCDDARSVFDALLDLTLSLSWMTEAIAAAGLQMVGDELRLLTSRNVPPEILKRCACVPLGRCLCGQVAETKRTMLVTADDMDDRHDHPLPRDGKHGHATLPLLYEGEVLGVLNVYLAEGAGLEPQQIDYLEAATAVTAAALREQAARYAARQARGEKLAVERGVLERVIESQEAERKRVSLELHDDLGQALSALLMEVRSARVSDEEEFGDFRKLVVGRVDRLITQVSKLAWELRPSILDDHGLDSALKRLVQHLAEVSGLPIDYEMVCPKELLKRLPSAVEVVLYRVTQEALNNAVRHAEASHVSVILVRTTASVALLVEDDGRGFDDRLAGPPQKGRGLGLMGMNERVSLVGGTLLIESAPGQGTTVRATIPVEIIDHGD